MSHDQDARDLLAAAAAIPRSGPGWTLDGHAQIELLLKEAHVEAMLAVAQEQRIANYFTALHTSVAGPDRAGWSQEQRDRLIAGILDGLGFE